MKTSRKMTPVSETIEARKYLSLEEVADRLGVNYQLIYKEVRAGNLPAVKLGRLYRVAEADLLGYLEARSTTNGATGQDCAICRKTYRSQSSLVASCANCGAAICFHCRLRQGLTTCCENDSVNQHEG